jgi:hypothetical protein
MLFVNSYGFNILVKSKLNLTASSALKVLLVRPKGSGFERVIPLANLVSAARGEFTMPIEQGDLSEVGTYQVQVFDVTPGKNEPSSIGEFTVLPVATIEAE